MLKAISAAVAIAACLLAVPLRAQGLDPLPDPCKISGFTADEQSQIQTYVQNRLQRMAEGVPGVEGARAELNLPLQRACVSVAFRQLYRAAAIGGLTKLAGDANENIAINALYVLKEIADDQSRQVIQQYTADQRDLVRYAAITSMKYTFAAIDKSAPALNPEQVSQMVSHLAERIAAEADPVCLDAIVRALLEAGAITRDGYSAPADEAMIVLANQLGARLRTAGESDRTLLLTTGLLVGEGLSARLAGGGAANRPEIARAGAAFSGEMLAHLAYLANEGRLPQARRLEIDLTTLSERTIVFAYAKLGSAQSDPGLAALVESGDDKEFFARVRGLVLALDGPPCSLPADAMDRIRQALEGKG